MQNPSLPDLLLFFNSRNVCISCPPLACWLSDNSNSLLYLQCRSWKRDPPADVTITLHRSHAHSHAHSYRVERFGFLAGKRNLENPQETQAEQTKLRAHNNTSTCPFLVLTENRALENIHRLVKNSILAINNKKNNKILPSHTQPFYTQKHERLQPRRLTKQTKPKEMTSSNKNIF